MSFARWLVVLPAVASALVVPNVRCAVRKNRAAAPLCGLDEDAVQPTIGNVRRNTAVSDEVSSVAFVGVATATGR